MPRKGSVAGSRKPLRQKTLLKFFQAGSSQAHNDTSSPSDGEQSKPTTSATRNRAHSNHKASRSRKAVILASSDSEKPSDDGGSQSSDVGAIDFEEPRTSLAVEDIEDDIALSPKRPVGTPRKLRRLRAVSVEKASLSEESDGEPEVVGVPIYRRKKSYDTKPHPARKGKLAIASGDSEDDEPEPKRRKLVKGVRPATPEGDLLDEVDSDSKS